MGCQLPSLWTRGPSRLVPRGSTYMCKALGVKHMQTTAYRAQSNEMVQHFHRQLKAALRARCSGEAWMEQLPWVLLGLHAALKDEVGVWCCPASCNRPNVHRRQLLPR